MYSVGKDYIIAIILVLIQLYALKDGCIFNKLKIDYYCLI